MQFHANTILLCIICYVDIDVSGPFQSLTLGSTTIITCSVANVPSYCYQMAVSHEWISSEQLRCSGY